MSNEYGLFEQATRKRLRFNTNKGIITTEDLWVLAPEQLNQIYITLDKESKEKNSQGLFKEQNETNSILDLKLKIIEHIFNHKQKIIEANRKRRETIERQQKIAKIIEKKKEKELENMDIEKLEEMLKSE
jgi:hypothetical protein